MGADVSTSASAQDVIASSLLAVSVETQHKFCFFEFSSLKTRDKRISNIHTTEKKMWGKVVARAGEMSSIQDFI